MKHKFLLGIMVALLIFSSLTAQTATLPQAAPPQLKVATKSFEPFVIDEGSEYVGFSIDLWKALAQQMTVEYQLYGVESLADLLNEVKRGAADLAIAGISITSERVAEMDFSHPFYESGLQILVLDTSQGLWATARRQTIAIVTSPQLYYGIGTFVIILLAIAHTIWFSERRHNPEFPESYLQGIWESLWWAAVTVTTVGYGDKTPKKLLGRLVGIFWMCAGYFVFAYFTATMSTIFTLQELQGAINSPQDLQGKRVAAIAISTAAQYLNEQNIKAIQYESKEDAYSALIDQKVDAVVYDAPALQYYASHEGEGQVKVVGSVFQHQNYGIALPIGSPYRKPINSALLKLIENGTYDEIHQRWFGSRSGEAS